MEKYDHIQTGLEKIFGLYGVRLYGGGYSQSRVVIKRTIAVTCCYHTYKSSHMLLTSTSAKSLVFPIFSAVYKFTIANEIIENKKTNLL